MAFQGKSFCRAISTVVLLIREEIFTSPITYLIVFLAVDIFVGNSSCYCTRLMTERTEVRCLQSLPRTNVNYILWGYQES